jgi:hypothetical protein
MERTGGAGELSHTLIGPKSEEASDSNSSWVYGGLGYNAIGERECMVR